MASTRSDKQGFLSGVRERVRHYLFDDSQLKLLALLIVVVIWFSVAGQTRVTAPIMIHNIDVKLDNPPSQFAVTSSDPAQVDIEVQGPEDVLRELRIAAATRTSDLEAYADLTGLGEGIYRPRLKIRGLPEGQGVVLKKIDPDTVRVMLDPIRTREVTVDPRFIGSVPDGYKLTGAYLEPNKVTVSGPESLLSKVDKLTTTTVSLNGRVAPFTETVDVDVTEPEIFVKERLVLHVQVEEDTGTQTFTVPVTTAPGAVAGVIEPSVVIVRLKGPLPLLRQLSAADISATISPDGVQPRLTLEPHVVVDGEAAGRVEVESVTPKSVRWRK
jgi:hypothetical protein